MNNVIRNTEYTEIAKAAVSENRNIVVSKSSRGGYKIAQQLMMKEGESVFPVFMKGGLYVRDLNGLYQLRDALNYTIDYIEGEENDVWDE